MFNGISRGARPYIPVSRYMGGALSDLAAASSANLNVGSASTIVHSINWDRAGGIDKLYFVEGGLYCVEWALSFRTDAAYSSGLVAVSYNDAPVLIGPNNVPMTLAANKTYRDSGKDYFKFRTTDFLQITVHNNTDNTIHDLLYAISGELLIPD